MSHYVDYGRYEVDALKRIRLYKARCPWCDNAPLFIHARGHNTVLCDACDVEWAPEDEAVLFVTHADKLACRVERPDPGAEGSTT